MKHASKIITLGGIALLMAGSHAQAQTTIADWTFESDAIAVNNSPAADIGSGTASSIGMATYATPNVGVTTDDVLQGATGDTGANGVANLTQIWRVRAQAGSSGAANGWSSLAPIGTQGAVFAASTVGVTGPINVSFDWYATTQGEANMQLEYTVNGTTWNNLQITPSGSDSGLVAMNNSSGSTPNTVVGYYVSDSVLNAGQALTAGQDWFTTLTATINDPAADNDANFAIEMVNATTGTADVSTKGTALNNTSGNWRFDNIDITTATAVPEPSVMALLGLGFPSLVWQMRRGRKS